MIKNKINFIVCLVCISIFSIQCAASTRSQLQDGGIDYITEGWIDDNTFQVRTIGAPNPESKGFVKRRTQSEEAALLSAQKRVVELMIGSKVSGSSSSKNGELDSIEIKKTFEGVIKGGAIIKKTFDAGDNCEITYKIHAKGLKEKAETVTSKE